jgi:hypothetical protein
MAERDVEALRTARENFVRKRRIMAEQMAPPGAAASHFAPSFVDLQAAIEAIDRAILDEEGLPHGYGANGADLTDSGSEDGSNVEHVDFDPA